MCRYKFIDNATAGNIELEVTVDEANVMVLPLCGLSGFQRQPLPLQEQLFFAKVKTLKLEKGRAKEYIKTTAESENKRIQEFCGECGSQLYGCDLDRNGYNVRIGCLDQCDSLSPVKHVFGISAQKRVHNLDGCLWFKRGSNNSETM